MRNLYIVLAMMVMLAGCGEAKKAETTKVNVPTKNKGMVMQAMAGSTSSPNSMLASGMDSLRQGDVRQAIKSFDEAIRENPKNVEGYMILGQTYMYMKEYNRAIDTLTVATRVAPDNGQAHYLLATNFGLAGNYQMARVQAQRSAEIFRKNQDENNFKRSVALLQGLPSSGGLPSAGAGGLPPAVEQK